MLANIARLAIKEHLSNETLLDHEELLCTNPWLGQDQAVFVTLTKNGVLRGCVGSLLPYRSLINDLVANACNAAFCDPRFPPINAQELDAITIEVSVLSLPKELSYVDTSELKEKIIPFRHGVIIQHNGHSATFLPQVWEQLPSFDLFFSHLLAKAGLPQNSLDEHPVIYTYEAKKWAQR